MRKPKVGDYILIKDGAIRSSFVGKIAKVLLHPESGRLVLNFGKPIITKHKDYIIIETSNLNYYQKDHYIFLTSYIVYDVVLQDNAINRLLYPEYIEEDLYLVPKDSDNE